MKRINNKYRNNNGNNQIYSLNYKFDSTSIAGKFSGTALDLIKRYNELAKDASSNNDYISAEIFRQYAEHYRKIVTDINEKKNQNRQQYMQQDNQAQENQEAEAQMTSQAEIVEEQAAEPVEKKSFTVVEISHAEAESVAETPAANDEPVRKPKRVYRRHQTVAE